MRDTSTFNSYNRVPPKGISWKAIFAGTVAALALMLILNLIGLAVGLWSFEPTEEGNPLNGIGTGAIIWWVVSNLIVLFVGGFVAGRVGISFSKTTGVIHGIMTWALFSLISAWLVTSAIGSIISGVGNVVGEVLSTTGRVVEDQLGPVIKNQFDDMDISLDDARKELYSLLEDTDKAKLDPQYLELQADKSVKGASEETRDMARQPGGVDSKIEGIFRKTKNNFKQSFEAVDKQALVNILVERTEMTESEATARVDEIFAEFDMAREEFDAFIQESKETAKVKAENIAEAIGAASMYLAVALILGAIAGALGGFTGIKHLRKDCIKNDYLTDDTNVHNISH